MKPVALLQHDKTQGPGVLLRCLEEAGIGSRTFCPDQGDALPSEAGDFSGIVLLGSNRSVNDGLPWMDEEMHLVQRALQCDVPLLGHCFGAQMISKAMGGRVCTNAWANIGWQKMHVTPSGHGLFDDSEFVAFNWHYETFQIPPGARRLLFGRHCLNKGFAIGKNLAFQCHLEVTEDIVREWCCESDAELCDATGPAVQRREQILSRMKEYLPQLHRVARRVYLSWASQLPRPTMAHYHGGW